MASRRRRKALITFEGWDGKWWRRIRVGEAVYEAATWVMPFKYSAVLWGLELLGVDPAQLLKKRRG